MDDWECAKLCAVPKAKQSREVRFLEAVPPSLLEQRLGLLTSVEVSDEKDETSNSTRAELRLVVYPSEESDTHTVLHDRLRASWRLKKKKRQCSSASDVFRSVPAGNTNPCWSEITNLRFSGN